VARFRQPVGFRPALALAAHPSEGAKASGGCSAPSVLSLIASIRFMAASASTWLLLDAKHTQVIQGRGDQGMVRQVCSLQNRERTSQDRLGLPVPVPFEVEVAEIVLTSDMRTLTTSWM
jgi:hypothetical protein